MNAQTATTAAVVLALSIPLSVHGQATAETTTADVIVFGSTAGGSSRCVADSAETDRPCGRDEHRRISSLRIEGTWMIIGQSAGVAAALAADQDIAVQELKYAILCTRLLGQKQVLDLPEVPMWRKLNPVVMRSTPKHCRELCWTKQKPS